MALHRALSPTVGSQSFLLAGHTSLLVHFPVRLLEWHSSFFIKDLIKRDGDVYIPSKLTKTTYPWLQNL